MEASRLGIANLKRILPQLREWSAVPGQPYEDLEELYGQVINQLRRYAGHVTTNVGGIYEYRKTADEEGVVFTPVAKADQARAVAFLNEFIFETPNWLIDKEILQRISPTGAIDRVRSLQVRTLQNLFNEDRLGRMIEDEALNGSGAYGLSELFNDTREGIFSEVYTGKSIDTYRRNLQRAYVDMLVNMLYSESEKIEQTDARALSRMTLMQLHKDLKDNQSRQQEIVSSAHLTDLSATIERALESPMVQMNGQTPTGR